MLGRRYGSVLVLGPISCAGVLGVARSEGGCAASNTGLVATPFRNKRRLLGFLLSMGAPLPRGRPDPIVPGADAILSIGLCSRRVGPMKFV
jgi:hypothetical protein